jgi:hypothetical protein
MKINPIKAINFRIRKLLNLITEEQYQKFFKDAAVNRNDYVHEIAWFLLTEKNIITLANLMKNKNVLSVAAGMGYAELWLKEKFNINIKITDKGNSGYFNKELPQYVEKIDALQALNKYKNWYDITFIAWPPYQSNLALNVLKKMKKNSEMIIIGEGYEGCVANDDFWEEIENKEKYQVKEIYDFDSFWGINDYITVIRKI